MTRTRRRRKITVVPNPHPRKRRSSRAPRGHHTVWVKAYGGHCTPAWVKNGTNKITDGHESQHPYDIRHAVLCKEPGKHPHGMKASVRRRRK